MFGSDATPYDLNFRLLGTPVRVSPWFWVMTLGFGMRGVGNDVDIVPALLWVAAVFISILLHEFGHVLAARMCHFGVDEVVLYQLGGYAALRPPHGERLAINDILISLAGPCAGFLLYVGFRSLIWIYPEVVFEFGNIGKMLLVYLLYINLYWGLFNLLPIYPLDGGQATRTFLMALSRGGASMAAVISIVAAAVMGIYMFQQQNGWIAIMMIFFIILNMQMLDRRRF